ncbi:MAG TPA: DUF5103 domain-containing protein [Flavitalea sp.]|nr:DUF5103 domain-containing protein [Flavitalea sp.]
MKILVPVFLFISVCVSAQLPEMIYNANIKSVRFHGFGDQLGLPMMKLGGSDRLELHFDDLDANIKNYSYTYQLCNADWTPAILSTFDYIRGFSQVRISTYRMSSIAFTRYTHYQAIVPDRNSVPSRSGNYLLKVFVDGDTSKLAFTRRFFVYDEKASISAEIQQPFNGQIFRTHQKIQFRVNLNERLDVINALQQIKVVIQQNNRWDNTATGLRPAFFSSRALEYNTENDAVFPAGKEWRWLDLRSFRLQSDRVESAKYETKSTDIIVKTDIDRSQQRFNFYRDANGRYIVDVSENINPFWQGDYAHVHFSFKPPNNTPLEGKNIFVFGQLSDYDLSENNRMTWNAEKGVYEKSLFLKQGYYDYTYVTTTEHDPSPKGLVDQTEGNFWETENDYTILVYYRSMGGRADELVALARVNSLSGRQGIRR